jgi:hypothetical protein
VPPKGTIFGCPFDNSYSIFCIPINPNDTVMVNEKAETHVYKIIEIKKQKGVYRIKMESDTPIYYQDQEDSLIHNRYFYPIYEVFSIQTNKQTNEQTKYKKIKKGGKYKLTLNPYFIHAGLVDFAIREVYINGIPFGISTGNTNIYTTQNLNGLYYILFIENE